MKMYNSKQLGLSLVELMVAIALSALLMLGVTRMFADSLNSNATETALSEIRESARIAMDMIKRDIRMVGFQGDCAPATMNAMENSVLNFASQALGGIEGNGTTSDSLMMFTASEDFANAEITNFSNAGNITLDNPVSYAANDIFLISDCQNVAIFTPAGAGANTQQIRSQQNIDTSDFVIQATCSPGTPCSQRHPLYRVGSMVGGVPQGLVYDINGTTLRRDGVDMVDGIENMQVLYGVIFNNGLRYCDIDDFGNAAGDCQWQNLRKIRISLISVSRLAVHPQPTQQTFPILNTANANNQFIANDRLLRRVFTTTINLRNRG
ncbi:PilW family protein [Endozoicomonas arenosclerae]|uniref:PilW family protein n=1 Tax=Endozoicomonas arenosclerae TaxID=1633495 RepID=UPI000785E1FF|nr:PilW family protein [Endozoicomonas arenosclerae]